MGGPRMALLVVIPRTAEAASATKTTMVEVEDRVSPTSKESRIAPQGPLAIRTMKEQAWGLKAMEEAMGDSATALAVVIPRTAEAANATKTTMEGSEQGHGPVLVADLTRPSPVSRRLGERQGQGDGQRFVGSCAVLNVPRKGGTVQEIGLRFSVPPPNL